MLKNCKLLYVGNMPSKGPMLHLAAPGKHSPFEGRFCEVALSKTAHSSHQRSKTHLEKVEAVERLKKSRLQPNVTSEFKHMFLQNAKPLAVLSGDDEPKQALFNSGARVAII